MINFLQHIMHLRIDIKNEIMTFIEFPREQWFSAVFLYTAAQYSSQL